ncbi:ABC transporter ATP-binding protein [Herbiconiux sp. CPCC 205763]|uniref:ABC transporter ATP-binding protein n=1 Tax=Herbiconiux aconitum TaxID=2970913 RepID=A0ABT2GQ41_9MICO|nr:ABC transporter ATP-binding protein [Herbiconiux aconitum]MCS5718308.1 ABC transporter ATP-binding protein [Herbiconiux aconitum]
MTSAIALEHVTRTFRNGAGVFDLDLSVHPGEVVALVGLNGAGKSTLMRVMLGMLRPHAGDARLAGSLLNKAPSGEWRRVGHLVDYPLAYPELTAQRNLELSARLRGVVDVDDAIARILSEFALEEYAGRKVRALSLGNRQRVGLAAALQHSPRVIVLDEPTNALDPAGVIRLRESLLRRAAAGTAVLVSSHHLDEVARIAHRIVVMNAGRLIGSLDPSIPDIEHAFFETVRLDDEKGAR